MSDAFIPLNLNEIYNAGPENLEVDGKWLWPFRSENQGETALTTMPSGDCSFWGIPFSLAASDAARRFVVVADIDSKDLTSTVAIPVRKKTLRLLFAHTCSSLCIDFYIDRLGGICLGTAGCSYRLFVKQ